MCAQQTTFRIALQECVGRLAVAAIVHRPSLPFLRWHMQDSAAVLHAASSSSAACWIVVIIVFYNLVWYAHGNEAMAI